MSGILDKKNVYVFVAVRMKSSRLALKAMLDIYGKPLLLRLVERISESIPLDKIVICTSDNSQDDEIIEFSIRHDLNFFRGDEMDVISRFIGAAKKFNARTIVRVTGDNPLTDPLVLNKMVDLHLDEKAEYTFTNDLPVGTRSEIIDIYALKRIHSQLSNPKYSEYMTLMLKRPDKLNIIEFHVDRLALKRPEISLTVDTLEDMNLVRDIYSYFDGVIPSLERVISWLDANPSKKILINSDISVLSEKIDCSYITPLTN
jgi:spore coat polysaccharide biosynthesis protein SpsF